MSTGTCASNPDYSAARIMRILRCLQEGGAAKCPGGGPLRILEQSKGNQAAGLPRPREADSPACGEPILGGFLSGAGHLAHHPGEHRPFEPGAHKNSPCISAACWIWPAFATPDTPPNTRSCIPNAKKLLSGSLLAQKKSAVCAIRFTFDRLRGRRFASPSLFRI